MTADRVPAPDQKGLKTVAKALELLCCFDCDHTEWGVTELAKYMGLHKSTVHRLLTTFENAAFVERTPERRYRLGIRTIELGNMFQFHDRLIKAADRGLRILAEATGSIAHLTRLDGRDTIELLRCRALTREVTARLRVSVRREAHATAKGKAFLAYGGEDFVKSFIGNRRFLKKYTSHTIGTPDALRAELAQIRKQGYAVADEESQLGLRCLAVPVITHSAGLVAALSISNTKENLSEEDFPRLVPKLSRLAKEIANGLDSPAGRLMK
jgi:DNA-binding IclR family transcriptional regulator